MERVINIFRKFRAKKKNQSLIKEDMSPGKIREKITGKEKTTRSEENETSSRKIDGFLFLGGCSDGEGNNNSDVISLDADWFGCRGRRRNASWERKLTEDVNKVQYFVLQRNLKTCGLV